MQHWVSQQAGTKQEIDVSSLGHRFLRAIRQPTLRAKTIAHLNCFPKHPVKSGKQRGVEEALQLAVTDNNSKYHNAFGFSAADPQNHFYLNMCCAVLSVSASLTQGFHSAAPCSERHRPQLSVSWTQCPTQVPGWEDENKEQLRTSDLVTLLLIKGMEQLWEGFVLVSELSRWMKKTR